MSYLKISAYAESLLIKLQSQVRRFITVRKYRYLKTTQTYDNLNIFLDSYIQFTDSMKSLSEFPINCPKFPNKISEYLVIYALFKKYNMAAHFNIKQNIILGKKKIRVKGFSSFAPSSFGKNEEWDYLYFVDCRNYKKKNFSIWEIKLSNNHPKWKSIMVNKTDTYMDKCNQKKPIRASFLNIVQQLSQDCSCIYTGYLENLFLK